MTKKNQIKIHQAFYGENNNRHECLSSTIDDAELNTFLTGFTDRPGAVPAGLMMKPYHSAKLYKENFLFSLSFPDELAQRGGMVFTHVLIINVSDIEYVNNLYVLFSYFCKSIPENKISVEELSISTSSLEADGSFNTFPEYIFQSIKKLSTDKTPIFFCGESELFVKLISSIWAGLSAILRTKISYTAGFSTANIDVSKTFILFQKSLENSLKTIDFVSGGNCNLKEVNSTLEKSILKPSIEKEFEEFLKDLNVIIDDWQTLELSAKAYDSFQNYSTISSDALKQLIRQIAKISPQKNDGKIIKDKIITEFVNGINSEEEINIKSLKNLPLDAYDSGENIIANSIKNFVEKEFNKTDDFNEELMADVIILSDNETELNWWHFAIRSALSKVIRESDENFQNLWKLLVRSDKCLFSVLSAFPKDKKYEKKLIKYIPLNISKNIAKDFAESTLERSWMFLHAYLIQIYLTPKEALKQQFLIEKNLQPESLEGTNYIIKKISEEDLLLVTLETKYDYFIDEYANRSVLDISLLNNLDVSNDTWLLIWAKTLEVTNNVEIGINNLLEKVEHLLNGLSQGVQIPTEIISQISSGKYADISDLNERPAIWHYLPTNKKKLFLEATANGLLNNISTKGLSGEILEPELSNYISSDAFMTTFLNANSKDLNVVLEVYENIGGLKDSFMADYIRYYSGNLKDLQSARLGNLITSKQFSSSASAVFDKAKKNDTFKIALTKCQELIRLNFWDTIIFSHLFGKKVSNEDVFSALLEITKQLYPQGPEDRNIWQKSNGNIGKLYGGKSREENWQIAINLLKNGGGGKNISANSFIKVMMEDYPNNPQLKEILKYFK